MDALDDDDDDDDDYSDVLGDEWFMFWSSHEEVLEAIMMLSMRSWSSWRLWWCFLDDDDGFYTHTHPRCSYEVCCFVRSIYYHLSLFLSLLITFCCVRIRRYLGIHNFFFFFLCLCLLPLQACNMGEVYWGTLSMQFSFGDPQYWGMFTQVLLLLWIVSSFLFVGSALLQGRDIVMHPEVDQSLVSLHPMSSAKRVLGCLVKIWSSRTKILEPPL
jgi:hypothetical protein